MPQESLANAKKVSGRQQCVYELKPLANYGKWTSGTRCRKVYSVAYNVVADSTGLLLRLKSAKFSENSNLYSSRSSKVIDLGVNRKRIYNFLLVINSNFGRKSYSFRDWRI